MPKVSYRANLSAAVFPMAVAQGGRTVIVPESDGTYDRRLDPQGEQKNAGVPQALYLENVIPTANGYQSVGYKQVGSLPAKLGGGLGQPDVVNSMYLYIENALVPLVYRFLVVFRKPPSGGGEIVAMTFPNKSSFAFTQCTGALAAASLNSSSARVRGSTYVFASSKLYLVTNTAGEVLDFSDVSGTVTGLTLADVIAVCACSNYLIAALNDGTIAWSSTTSPLDFTPSLVTGAGSETPNDVKGDFKFLREAPNGFYIYTESEVVYATYTGNSRYPFKFRAVSDSGGYSFQHQVFGDSRSATHIGIDNTNKIKQINPDGAIVIAEELSTYLDRVSTLDEFNQTTNTFSETTITPRSNNASSDLTKAKLNYFLDRFVIVSIPAATYWVHFVYDIPLKRYGKFKTAGDLYSDTKNLYHWEVSVNSPCYKQTLDYKDTSYTFESVFALGKLQLVRSRKITLEGIEVEGLRSGETVVLPSDDGLNFAAPVTPTQDYDSGELTSYKLHRTATNHTILCKGAFNLSTIQVDLFTSGGY